MKHWNSVLLCDLGNRGLALVAIAICLSNVAAFGQALKTGVFVAGRDLERAAFVGTHQFVILVPKDAAKFPECRDLGDGTKGMVVSTIKKDDRLQVAWFDAGDYQATREHTNPGKYVSNFKPDFDTEVAAVNIGGVEIDAAIAKLRSSIEHYVSYERTHSLVYPSNADSIKNKAGLINSNSWAQSLIEHNFGRGKVREDFTGADYGHQNRIDVLYFVK